MKNKKKVFTNSQLCSSKKVSWPLDETLDVSKVACAGSYGVLKPSKLKLVTML